MKRKIIKIDENKCIGCGLCAEACHEGAIEMINGKAKLIRDDYCDGLGDCLPVCPSRAINFEMREAEAYNESAVAVADSNQIRVRRFSQYIHKKQNNAYRLPETRRRRLQ